MGDHRYLRGGWMGKGDINRFGEDINRFCADINHIGDYIDRFREDINRFGVYIDRFQNQPLDEVFFRRCGINLVLRPNKA
jgi:hypothetical protein